MAQAKEHVGIGEYTVTDEDAVLESIGLGSCVGVCVWDKTSHVGGLAHVMLPSSEGRGEKGNPYRYADKAVDALIEDLAKKGANRASLEAKIFGGASLFEGVKIQVGQQNVEKVKERLKMHKVRVVAEDVGGTHGRSVWFDTRTGKVVVGRVFGETKEY